MPPMSRPEQDAVALWLSSQLAASYDRVLAEAVPDELLALAAGVAERG